MAETTMCYDKFIINEASSETRVAAQRHQAPVETEQKSQLIQYAAFYYHRLQALKPKVQENAKKTFPLNATFISNILDIRQNTLTVLIGTLFKDMKLKPNILKDITGTLGTRQPMKYCSAEDNCILEDSSGRIRIKDKTEAADLFSKIVTGSIIGCLGRADINGIFYVENYVYAGYIIDTPNIFSDMKFKTRRSLFDRVALQDQGRNFVAFVSGLELGMPQDQLSLELLQRFIRGDTGSYDE